ncbi:MAG: hypothetical protein CO098_09240 [Bacteroidetes bacterium CG_4_9_14_3_um_filter_41_19]|nr:MAG: hypothetical protein CO098_09240 [Bacteroidetes bacterium CG_4_9_14_3_um_filter_41_19]
MPGRSFNANSYRYGFNKGSEKDDEISGVIGGHFTTKFREGDTRLLRWWSVDPKADLQPWQSPYSYMDGNPVKNNDPDGDCPWCITAGIGALVGAAVEYGGQVAANVVSGGSLTDFDTYTNVDVADIVIAAGEGAIIGLTGGLGAAGKVGTTTIKVVNASAKIGAAAAQGAVDTRNGETQTVFDGSKDATTAVSDGVFNLIGSAAGGKAPTGANKYAGPLKNPPTPKEAVKSARAQGPVNRTQRISIENTAKVNQKATNIANETIRTAPTGIAGEAVENVVNDGANYVIEKKK